MPKFVIHCDACGKNIITTGNDTTNLVEIKTSLIPGRIPMYNKEKKETEVGKCYQRPKMFKCPKCGRGVVARKLIVSDSKHIEEKKDEKEPKPFGRETGTS